MNATMIAALLGPAGCVTGIHLTEAGQGVRYLDEADKPSGCRLIGDVAIGIPPDAARAATEEELITLMRNKAGQSGGNVVILDWKEERNPNDEEARHFVGRGRAYACPQEEEASSGGSAPIERDTGLEEEESDGQDDEGEGDDDDDTGLSDDDLLGD